MKKHLLLAALCAAVGAPTFAYGEATTYPPYQCEAINESLQCTSATNQWTGNIILDNDLSEETKTISPLQTSATDKQMFFDKSAEKYTVYQGATINITNGEGNGRGGTQKFIFVDWNKDGRFGPETITDGSTFVNAADGTIVEGSELVDYTAININGWIYAPGYTESDQTHDYYYAMKFTVPESTEPGEYRVRYKYNWNGYNPNTMLLNRGIIVDFTIVVEEAPATPIVPAGLPTKLPAGVTGYKQIARVADIVPGGHYIFRAVNASNVSSDWTGDFFLTAVNDTKNDVENKYAEFKTLAQIEAEGSGLSAESIIWEAGLTSSQIIRADKGTSGVAVTLKNSDLYLNTQHGTDLAVTLNWDRYNYAYGIQMLEQPNDYCTFSFNEWTNANIANKGQLFGFAAHTNNVSGKTFLGANVYPNGSSATELAGAIGHGEFSAGSNGMGLAAKNSQFFVIYEVMFEDQLAAYSNAIAEVAADAAHFGNSLRGYANSDAIVAAREAVASATSEEKIKPAMLAYIEARKTAVRNVPQTGRYIRIVNSANRPFAIQGAAQKFPESVADGSDIILYTADKHLASYKYGVIATGTNLNEATTAESNVDLSAVKPVVIGANLINTHYIYVENGSTVSNFAHRFFYSNDANCNGGNATTVVPTDAGYQFTVDYVDALPVEIHPDGFGSIVVPVAIAAPATDVATLYTAAIAADGHLSFSRIEEAGEVIPANTHVIVKATAGTTVNIPLTYDATTDAAVNHEKLVGHHLTKAIDAAEGMNYYAKTAMANAANALAAEPAETVTFSKLAATNGKVTVPAGAMVFATENAADTADTIDVDLAAGRATTGIREITAEAAGANGVIYDLQGRRVNAAANGIFIVNGKKVMVK